MVNDSPRSISAPLEKRSLRPTQSQGDADETVLCLQPDLPLARKLCSASIKCVKNKNKKTAVCVRCYSTENKSSVSSVSSVCCRCRSSSSTGEADEPVAALQYRSSREAACADTSVNLATVTCTASGEGTQNKSMQGTCTILVLF